MQTTRCVLAGVIAVAGCGSDAIDPTESPDVPASAPRTITLITGDRVTVSSAGAVTIVAGPGRSKVTFVQSKDGDQLSVFPSDVLPLLGAGRLDARLFDVTQLIEDKLDRLAHLPLIIEHERSAGARARIGAQLGATTRVVRSFTSIDGVAVHAAPTGELWRTLHATTAQPLPAGIEAIWLDGVYRPTLDVSVPLIGAPQAWAEGFDGAGVTVAVLDSGIDAAHPDLADRVVGEMNFVAGDDIFDEDALDHVGHGTHVASTIAGTGAASQGRFRGVAPGAHLLDGKVCSVAGCPTSAMLAGMEWAAASGARIINLSIGARDRPGLDPLEQAVNRLTADHGILFVVAAGNGGAVTSPGSADAALTVGAFDKQDRLASFSSRGPRLGDAAVKPEIAGPGVAITAAASKDAPFEGAAYATLSGTSMATPHAAGSAAIVAQRHPDATAAQLKALLIGSAKPNPGVSTFAQGAGRVDVARAIHQQITAEPAVFDCGILRFPHDDDVPVTRTVTYRNAGTADLTLALAIRVPSGVSPAMFVSSAPTVTVPAGGAASVDVTCDTRADGPLGPLGAELTATAGDMVVQTPFGVVREEEAYDVRITGTSRSGGRSIISALLTRTEAGQRGVATSFGDATTLRLAKGSYLFMGGIYELGGDLEELSFTYLMQPPFDLVSDRTIELDARLGRPISISVPEPTARRAFATITSSYSRSDGSLVAQAFDLGSAPFCGQLGPPTDIPGFVFAFNDQWAKPDDVGTFEDSPYVYSLGWSSPGRAPNGLVRHVRRAELATVRQHYAVQQDGNRGAATAFYAARPPDRLGLSFVHELGFALPFSRTEYFNVDGGMEWSSFFSELRDGELVSDFLAPFTEPRAGISTQRWNTAVFSPTVADGRSASRLDNELALFIPWFADPFGRTGLTLERSHRMSLSQDGEPIPDIGIEGVFEVPPQLGHYRFEIESAREQADLPSSEVRAAWTFDSANTLDPTALPLSSISFRPYLDDHQAAPAGVPYLVPLVVVAQPGSSAGPLHRPTLEASYDDGATWHRALVVGLPHAPVALLFHPRGARWVSLHVHADGDDGRSVDETVIHAYRLR